jgi:VWFA-related protein
MPGGRQTLVGIAIVLGPLVAGPARAAAALVQEPTPPVQIAPVGTARVQVAVVVLDRQGRPVTYLKPEDFLILEDGKSQIVTDFVGPVSGPEAEPAVEATLLAPRRPAAPAESAGRHIVLAVDELHLAQDSLLAAKEALKHFVATQVSDDDEVAVISTGGTTGLAQPFTRNRFTLRRAIEAVGYQGYPGSAGRADMTEFQAESIERGDPEALALATTELTLKDMLSVPATAGTIVNPRYGPESKSQARSILSQALAASGRSVRAIDRMLRNLAGIPGRKLAVLVSDGFLLGTGTGPEAIDLRRIFDASARAGVAVYCVDSRGLVAGVSGGDASSPGQATMVMKPGVREGYDRMGTMVMRESLGSIAAGTGGLFVHGGNDLAAGLDRILRDSDASYLLGYEPTVTERNGRFRNIEVKLPGRAGLTVRARKGYFGPDDRLDRGTRGDRAEATQQTRRIEELRNALMSLVPLPDMPIRVSADFAYDAREGTELVLRAQVELGALRFEREGDHDKADVEILGVVYDERGDVVGEFKPEHTRLDLDPAAAELARRQGLSYKRSAALKPGAYQVRVAARESTFSQLGSAAAWVELPELKGSSLKLSSLFLLAGAPPPKGAAADAPPPDLRDVQVLHRVGLGESLYYQIDAYTPARDAAGATDVVLQSQVWSGSDLQGASPLQPVAFEAKGTEVARMSGSIALEGLAPGPYELRVLVVDRKAGRNAVRRSEFTIE